MSHRYQLDVLRAPSVLRLRERERDDGTLLCDGGKEILFLHRISGREDYLRNRFRNYLTRLRLYTPAKQKLELKIRIEGPNISVLAENL